MLSLKPHDLSVGFCKRGCYKIDIINMESHIIDQYHYLIHQ